MAMSRAVVGQRVARLPFPAGDGGASPTLRLHFTTIGLVEANALLGAEHYLGPIGNCKHAFGGWVDDVLVACCTLRQPTARYLPTDWLELNRWCLTPEAGENAGSRMWGYVQRWLRKHTEATTVVSYSDPSVGHTGTLYKASGWRWAPTWHRLSPPPTGNGSWGGDKAQSVKDRWVFELRDDPRRAAILEVKA